MSVSTPSFTTPSDIWARNGATCTIVRTNTVLIILWKPVIAFSPPRHSQKLPAMKAEGYC